MSAMREGWELSVANEMSPMCGELNDAKGI